MTSDTHPTFEQKEWLARVFGRETWKELCGKPEFVAALESSLDVARRIALKHLAAKELAFAHHFSHGSWSRNH